MAKTIRKNIRTIKDDEGNDIPLKDAAKLVEGGTYEKLFHYVTKYGANNLDDVRDIMSNIKKHGRNHYAPRKTYLTSEGVLTSREVWEIHPYKDFVSIEMVRCRLSSGGGMNPELWSPPKRNGCTRGRSPMIICEKCRRELNSRQFELLTRGKNKGKKHKHCNKCRGKTKKNIKHNNIAMVEYGDTVISNGKKYFVSQYLECDSNRGLVSGFRIMDNGQILRNTTIQLGTNWKQV